MTVYEQMATAGEIVHMETHVSGNAPHRQFTLYIRYANGLGVTHDGSEKGFIIKSVPFDPMPS